MHNIKKKVYNSKEKILTNTFGYLRCLNSTEEDSKNNVGSIPCEFIVHSLDDVSWNNQTISTETCEKYKDTIINQPIVGKYIKESYAGAGDDNFGDHYVTTDTARDTGEQIAVTKTVPIGVFNSAEIVNIDGVNCFCAKGVLWKERFPNAVGLIEEWNSRGVRIMSSCEYMYSSYMVREDGVEEVLNPCYTGHCVLGSEERGNNPIVLPAYDASCLTSLNSINEALNIDINNNTKNNEEKDGDKVDNIFVNALNASLGEKRDKIMDALSAVMSAKEFNSTWIGMYNIDDDNSTITYESMNENGDWSTYQVGFSANEDGSYAVDMATKKAVEYKLVEKESMNAINTELAELKEANNTLTTEKETAEQSLNTANEEIADLKEKMLTYGSDKVELVDQITTLNNRIAELESYEATVKEMEYNSRLETATKEYTAKFESINAKDKVESEDVMALIKETINEDKLTALNAKLMLSDMLLTGSIQNKQPVQKETYGKTLNNLIPVVNASKANEERFGFEC